ncbi:MAG: hypothetical protein ACREAF_02785 [Nitrosopumilaceae archaeon]
MTLVVDCANDEEIVRELVEYMSKHGINAKVEGALVVTNENDTQKRLESFIKDTGKSGYEILRSDPETLVLAKVVRIEDFDLPRCEICGYVAPEEELFAHRRAHGIGF